MGILLLHTKTGILGLAFWKGNKMIFLEGEQISFLVLSQFVIRFNPTNNCFISTLHHISFFDRDHPVSDVQVECIKHVDHYIPPLWIMCLESVAHLLVMLNFSSNFLIYCSVRDKILET